jgi:hypothetical protein
MAGQEVRPVGIEDIVAKTGFLQTALGVAAFVVVIVIWRYLLRYESFRYAYLAIALTVGIFAIADFGLERHTLWMQILIISLLFVVSLIFAVGLLIPAYFPEHLSQFLGTAQKEGAVDAFLNLVASAAIITAGFAAIQALLVTHGVATLSGGPYQDYLDAATKYYLWNLLDAIPALNVPDTLNLALQHTFTDHISGSLALVYKFIVVFGIFKLIFILYRDSLDRRGLIYHER